MAKKIGNPGGRAGEPAVRRIGGPDPRNAANPSNNVTVPGADEAHAQMAKHISKLPSTHPSMGSY